MYASVPTNCPMSVCRVAGASLSVARAIAEVEDLGLAALIHQDVGRLEIAVDDAALVRVLDGVADVGHQLQAMAEVEFAARRRIRAAARRG